MMYDILNEFIDKDALLNTFQGSALLLLMEPKYYLKTLN